jgi:hypothetical protein
MAMSLKRFTGLAVATLSIIFASCSSSTGSPKEIEMLFRDRTEKNNVEGEFRVSLNDDVAQSAEFESLITVPIASKLKIGDLISLEFFESLNGVLKLEFLKSVENSRIVIEVFDKSISLLENESFKISGEPIKRVFIDKEAATKNLLRDARNNLQGAKDASVAAANKNLSKSTDSIKVFNTNYKAQLESLRSYIKVVENFIFEFPEFSEQSESLLTILRKNESAVGLAAVAITSSQLNSQIGIINELLSPLKDAEFRLFSAIKKSLDE